MAEQGINGQQTSIDFHYIKANSFRVVHADGVYGGPTPRGYIVMNFYSERAPIPQKITQELTPAGQLGGAIDQVGKGGIVRDMPSPS